MLNRFLGFWCEKLEAPRPFAHPAWPEIDYAIAQQACFKALNDRAAPFIDHTDQELMLIEALVGRSPPFVFPRSDYLRPRRPY